MTPVDNIRLPEPKLERAMILREMAAMGLTGCENQPVRELSGGMRRRVAILRALLCGADVIALDEPFKGLDEATRARVIAETKRLCRGKTVLLVDDICTTGNSFAAAVSVLREQGALRVITAAAAITPED